MKEILYILLFVPFTLFRQISPDMFTQPTDLGNLQCGIDIIINGSNNSNYGYQNLAIILLE